MEVDDGIPPGVYQYGFMLSANVPAPAMSLPDTAARVDDTAGHPDGPFHAEAPDSRRLRIPLTSGGLGQLALGDFTLETRFRLSVRDRGVLMGNWTTGQGAINLEIINDRISNKVRLYIQPVGGGTTVDMNVSADPVTSAIWDGAWYHLVGMRSGSTCYLYINGVKVGEKADTAGSFTMTGDYYYIKGDTRTGYELFDGDIENARLWTRALETNEVAALAAGAEPGGAEVSASGMLAEYASAYSPFNATYDNPMYRTSMVPPLKYVTRTNFTAEAWFRTTNAARAVLIGNYSGSTANAFNLEIRDTDSVRFLMVSDSETDVQSDTLPYDIHNGQWHHLAGIVRDSTAYLYMNGVEVKNIPYVSGSFDLSDFGLCIGKDMRNNLDVLAFNGDIRDARVWARALETNELAAIVTGSEPGSAAVAISNLLAEYSYTMPSNSLSKAGFPGSKFLRTYVKGTNSVTLVFDNLPRHAEVGLGMLLAQLDSLDLSGDLTIIKIDGQEILSAHFDYNSGDTRVSEFKLFGQVADKQLLLNTSVSEGIDLFHCSYNTESYNDNVYDLSLLEPLQKIPHTDNTLTLEIIGIQNEYNEYEGTGIDRLELNVPAIKGTMISIR